MIKNDLISVIIPAYNSEKYIEKCIESVLSQTYQNIEVIVVNDGSTDTTGYKVAKYKNVILLNKENGGLCSARNYGVKFARGKYIAFLDSDDFFEKDFIFELYKKTSGRKDELVMCDFLVNGKKESEKYTYMEVEGRSKIMSLFLHGGIYNRTVNKLYPYELIKDIPFATGRDMLEDAFFTAHILEKVNKIVRIPYAGYNYIRHKESMTRTKWSSLQIESYYANILEKNCVLARYIPTSDNGYFSRKVIKHLKLCMTSTCDINSFGITNKIIFLLNFLFKNPPPNKRDEKFVNVFFENEIINKNKIRHNFRRYIFYFAPLKLKLNYIKRYIKVLIKRP